MLYQSPRPLYSSSKLKTKTIRRQGWFYKKEPKYSPPFLPMKRNVIAPPKSLHCMSSVRCVFLLKSTSVFVCFRGISRLPSAFIFLRWFKLAHISIQVCTFHDGCEQGIDQQIFNRKAISRKITHPQSLFKYVFSYTMQGPVAYAENFHGGRFIQWHIVVICLWCVLFVTSQFDVIFTFPNQRFGEVCWHIRIFFYTHSRYFMCHCTEYKLSALQVRIYKINSTLRQPFTTAKIQAAC